MSGARTACWMLVIMSGIMSGTPDTHTHMVLSILMFMCVDGYRYVYVYVYVYIYKKTSI